jgi:hypothetical protein
MTNEITNQDLLNYIDRSKAQNFADVNFTQPGDILFETDNFLARVNRFLPDLRPAAGLERQDFAPNADLTQQGYQGETFSAPTIAAPGFVYPYHILDKRRQAQIEAETKAQQEAGAFNYDITEIKDEIRNSLFLDKQFEYYQGMLSAYKNDKRIGDGDETKALKYMNDHNILKTAGMKWKNLGTLYDKAYDNYIKVTTDVNSAGNSKYDEGTRQLAKDFETFIGSIDTFDPNNLDEFIKFHNKFNERIALADLVKEAVGMIKTPYVKKYVELSSTKDISVTALQQNLRDDFDKVANDLWGFFGDEKYSENEKNIFMNMLKNSFIEQSIDEYKVTKKNTATDYISKKLFDLELSQKATEEKEAAKPENRITTGEQDVSFTDPGDQSLNVIKSNETITFPKAEINVVPGDKVFVEGIGMVTINDAVLFKPIREFEAYYDDDALVVGKPSGEMWKGKRYIVGGTGNKIEGDYPKQRFVQAEINATGTYRDEYGDIQQDVIIGVDKNGKKIEIPGKQTVIVPQKNIKDKLTNQFGDNYTNALNEKPVENVVPIPEKKFISVTNFNKVKGTNFTKEQLQAKYPNFEIRD